MRNTHEQSLSSTKDMTKRYAANVRKAEKGDNVQGPTNNEPTRPGTTPRVDKLERSACKARRDSVSNARKGNKQDEPRAQSTTSALIAEWDGRGMERGKNERDNMRRGEKRHMREKSVKPVAC